MLGSGKTVVQQAKKAPFSWDLALSGEIVNKQSNQYTEDGRLNKDVPPRCLHPIPQNLWRFCHFRDEREFAEVMRLRILRWRAKPRWSGWAQCNNKCSQRMEAGGPESERRWRGKRSWGWYGWRWKGPWTGTWRTAPEAGKDKERASPSEPQNTVLRTHFRLLTSRTAKEWMCAALRHCNCGDVLQQQ